jgi:transcriptional regulator with XRE-family HTH domain
MLPPVRIGNSLDLEGIARRLATVRMERGIAQTRLDSLAGVGRGAVQRIEEGSRPELSVSVLARIADCLQMDLNWLIRGDDRESGLDVPIAGFLSQLHRLPGLLDFLEKQGAHLPLHVIARGLKTYRETAKGSKAKAMPKEGWQAFFSPVAKQVGLAAASPGHLRLVDERDLRAHPRTDKS